MNVNLSENDKIKILNSDDLYGIMQRILLRENKIDQDREHFWVIGLANNHRLLFIELISKGTINATLVKPMEVFSLALQKRAVKIMLVHNHPSGELKPSEPDKNITDRLIQVGKIVETEVLDHLIISDKSYLSFNDIGLLEELRNSKKYVPTFELIKEAKQESAEIAKRNNTVELAKEMKRQGLSHEQIATITGLDESKIKALKVRIKK
ncbi:DNA repair protein [Fulvivirga sp. M361]|uniref:JAB domain-containing protein n=1 Tax=Fulvivirga sp. M361 TaxID=2594266 RepID=UPI00117B3A70|nr:JAB domain-containing protein [Fulvivirga sp. M361]TRX49313.1 DNA repair protein [Fulvivirga sp. M361]